MEQVYRVALDFTGAQLDVVLGKEEGELVAERRARHLKEGRCPSMGLLGDTGGVLLRLKEGRCPFLHLKEGRCPSLGVLRGTGVGLPAAC